MSTTSQLLSNNESYADAFAHAGMATPPRLKVAVITCMDARIDPARVLGLEPGDAHVIRNAGGVVTDDVLRSLSISQHHLGTEEVLVIQHTGCGLLTFTDEEFAETSRARPALGLPGPPRTFDDLEQSVREGVQRIRTDPFILRPGGVKGFVYEVETGRVRQVAELK